MNFWQWALNCVKNLTLSNQKKKIAGTQKCCKIINLKDKFDLIFSEESWDAQLACCINFTSIILDLAVQWSFEVGQKMKGHNGPVSLPGVKTGRETDWSYHHKYAT